ncbi:hypothetical protein [Paenibacillus polymyxa]|uniref:hypothetical protein n=1 Tax=Paenibacillus polymyxa TaxID=1406 RepID=UPI0032AF2E7B
MHRIDLTNRKFGMLTVISKSDKKMPSNKGKTYWNCVCDCGNPHVVEGYWLTSGKTVSCGCKRKKHYIEMLEKRKELGELTHYKRRPQKKSVTGCNGVRKSGKKYVASIGYKYKYIHLGTFDKFKKAIAARKAAENKYFAPLLEGKPGYDLCEQCGKMFNKHHDGHKYCCDNCRSMSYRKRRVKQAAIKLCKQCGKPWTEPLANSKGKRPKHCKVCQDYFKQRYQKQKSPATI